MFIFPSFRYKGIETLVAMEKGPEVVCPVLPALAGTWVTKLAEVILPVFTGGIW